MAATTASGGGGSDNWSGSRWGQRRWILDVEMLEAGAGCEDALEEGATTVEGTGAGRGGGEMVTGTADGWRQWRPASVLVCRRPFSAPSLVLLPLCLTLSSPCLCRRPKPHDASPAIVPSPSHGSREALPTFPSLAIVSSIDRVQPEQKWGVSMWRMKRRGKC